MATQEEIRKAQARPIDGPYPEYAKTVRHLLGYFPEDGRQFLSLRAAEGKTGVKHTTIGTMARGFRADKNNTSMFALALDFNPVLLLRQGGHIFENISEDFIKHPDPFIGDEVNPAYVKFMDEAFEYANLMLEQSNEWKGKIYALESNSSARDLGHITADIAENLYKIQSLRDIMEKAVTSFEQSSTYQNAMMRRIEESKSTQKSRLSANAMKSGTHRKLRKLRSAE